MINFQGRFLSNFFASHLKKGSIQKGKNLLPKGSKFFPFRVNPFSEGIGVLHFGSKFFPFRVNPFSEGIGCAE